MENIAIIGMSTLFPKAKTPEQFWQNLLAEQDCRSEVSQEKMAIDPKRYYGKKGEQDTFYCLNGGYIHDFHFDCQGYQMPSSYLQQLDPLYQWVLHTGKQALVNGGYEESEALKNCGAILGNLSFPTYESNHLFMPLYHKVLSDELAKNFNTSFALENFSSKATSHADNGLIAGYPSALLAKSLGLGAQHFSLDAACASSVYALKLACDYLNSNKADLMLAGAVSKADPTFVHMGFSIFQAYPENNKSAPLDSDSQGLFAGEGAGMMLLKRHGDAVRDGDNILAVIKGAGLSNDGKGQFVLSPNSKGQVLAYERAFNAGGVKKDEVDFIECHATGTPKGDKVELASMEQFFKGANHKPLLGSVKSNLGHLLTAAGMPGLTKAIFALNEGKIPATINIEHGMTSANGFFSEADVPQALTNWPKQRNIRQAGVSVFGFGGADAHMVLQQGHKQAQASALAETFTKMAITGVAGHFGACDDLTAIIDAFNGKRQPLQSLPKNRWKGMQQHAGLMASLQHPSEAQGGFIEQFNFDYLRFKVPPNEQDSLIPQQLLLLKTADEALHDAGIKEQSNVAVLVAMGIELELHQYRGRVNLLSQIEQSLESQGISLTEQEQKQLVDISKDAIAETAKLNQYTSFIGNIMASRISALWDFSGPAFTVSSEENSVFRCIDIADNLFRHSDVEAVVVAAVDLSGSLENIRLRLSQGPLTKNPRPEVFANKGFVPGEGAGALVLQRGAENLNAYATIKACQFSHSLEQTASKSLQQAALDANDIDYIEAFDSGFAKETEQEQAFCKKLLPNAFVASSKNQFGHSFNAQGLLSVLAACFRSVTPARHVLVNSLGRDFCAGQLIIERGHRAYQKPAITPSVLVKSVVLGGKNIFLRLKQHQAFLESIADKMQPIAAVKNRVALPVITPVVSETSMTKPVRLDAPLHCDALNTQIQKTHAAFLKQSQQAQAALANALLGQTANAQTAAMVSAPAQPAVAATSPSPGNNPSVQNLAVTNGKLSPGIVLKERFNKPQNIVFDTDDLVEFAEGDIANVFGEEYKIIDSYSRRVRLPTTDYLLVTRVTDLEAKTHEFKKSYMATEYDIPIDAPFLIDGQIPWSVSVESGQCDLMLISYIGIDFEAKGIRVYRLLDCELTFLGDMAFGGETLRYEIHIDSYARNGDQLLFFFHYDCYVNGKKVLIMRGGCAGFFTDQELDDGKGVIVNDKDKAEIANAVKQDFTPLIASTKKQFDYQDMMQLVQGDIAACMGEQYQQFGRNPSLKFSSKKFLMIERVTSIEEKAGHWGLGILEGQKDLAPEHWYFPCHFKGDQVMAGSLMSEGCGQLAMFYMLWLGMHKHTNNARFQPIPGEAQTVRCRGQVTPQHNTLTYRMEVTALGMQPYPYLKANIAIILDGKVVVDFKNLAVMIKEQTADDPYVATLPQGVKLAEPFNKSQAKTVTTQASPEVDETGKQPFNNVDAPLMWVETDHNAAPIKGVKPIKHVPAPMANDKALQNRTPDTVPFTPWHLFEFATGDIGKCFGEKFNVYHGRIPPRTPCGDLQLVTQVKEINGERFDLKNPSSCVAEYVVPEDAWYFTKNSHPNWMPYSILMEISLQPNGFISGYMGTTLKYPEKDLFFRNLDGRGTLLKQIDLRGKTIVNQSKLLSTSVAGGAIIQSFTFDLLVGGEVFYKGSAVFGYFSGESLANQLGIDNGKTTKPWFELNHTQSADIKVIDLRDTRLKFYHNTQKPHYCLAGGQMNFVDQVRLVNKGGDYAKGYVHGKRTIDPSDWFFRYHFHQDPVMPGSLGVEAIIELLQVFALEHDLGKDFKNPRFIAPLTEVVWKYRGQITPENKEMSLDVHIKAVEKTANEVRIIGDANLLKDGLRIYHVSDIVLSIVEA